MAKKKVAVIGAGLGGLAAALRLRNLGWQVDVFDKNKSAGGKAGEFTQDNFRFDTGPSLLTMPFVLKELFENVGEKLEDYVTLERPEILCKYFFADSTKISAYSDINKFSQEIENNTIDQAKKVKKYLKYCEKIYTLSAELFLYKSFSEVKTFLNIDALKTLLKLKSLDTHRTMHEANQSFFNDSKTVQLFDRYATYNGSNPFEAPATLNIIQHVEYNLGGYISTSGIYSIPEAIMSVAKKKGVNFYFNSEVSKILHEENHIKGIVVNNEIRNYDIVVSNSDVENTYVNLLGDNHSKHAKKYINLEKSSSAIVFYWGIKNLNPTLEIHNILFSSDYKKEFDQLFNRKEIPDDPTIYIYISSKFKNDDAPQNCENWFVMINTPPNRGQDRGKDIEAVKDKIKSKIKSVLGFDIEKNILTEKVMTPKDIEKNTSSIGGSIYGISSNNKMAAFLRQKNRSKKYKGLYFCGGSAHPGGGIPLVLLSGKIVTDLITKYESK